MSSFKVSSKFSVGDEIYVDHPELLGHVCIIDFVFDDRRIRVYHPTKNWNGLYTSFDSEQINTRHLTPLDKLL